MEVLVLNGKTYVKASKAARDLGYTSDYVGQLCRGGHVDAHLVGRTWFVDQEQLGSHRVEKKRMSRVKAREQARKSIEEHKKLRVENTKNVYKNIAIHYEQDESELIPAVRKLDISSVHPHREPGKVKAHEHREDREPAYTVENEGEKLIMSGKLKVTDVSDDETNEDVIILKPKIERHRREMSQKSLERINEPVSSKGRIDENYLDEQNLNEVATFKAENKEGKSSSNFLSKLSARDIDTARPHTEGEGEMLDEDGQALTPPSTKRVLGAQEKSSSKPLYVSITIASLILLAGSLLVESTWTYSHDARTKSLDFSTSYSIDTENLLELIR